ncbi:hypothetical protein [Nostoc sp.]|uniref:hypothetical protein n=1 Tax=Nostoc sp. TaxID=1180 RepID=UPI002FF26F9F
MLHRSLNYIAERSLFISRKDAKEEESDRTLEILQAIALFNEPQRRREHRGRRERSHRFCRRSLFLNEPQTKQIIIFPLF